MAKLLPLLRRSGHGSIVKVSSCYAVTGRKGMGLYDATKAGQLALTRTLAFEEAAHGVRVNAVCPGSTLTDFHIARVQAKGKSVEQLKTERQTTSLLGSVGIEVREAANGQEAVEMWASWQPHLIWMDMRMPVMDGAAATRRIRTEAQEGKTVIIALTASILEEDRADILAAGRDDFLLKPFHAADLFALMHNIRACASCTTRNLPLCLMRHRSTRPRSRRCLVPCARRWSRR